MSDFLAIVHHLKTPLINHESLFKETSLIKKKKKKKTLFKYHLFWKESKRECDDFSYRR